MREFPMSKARLTQMVRKFNQSGGNWVVNPDDLAFATEEEEGAILEMVKGAILESNGLEMRNWHAPANELLPWYHRERWNPKADPETEATKCGATHCVAGWVQALCPSKTARTMMYASSVGYMLVPRYAAAGGFYVSNNEALKRLGIKKSDYKKAQSKFKRAVKARVKELRGK